MGKYIFLISIYLLTFTNVKAVVITPYLETIKINGVGYNWQTITTSNQYNNPIVVCSYHLVSKNMADAVTRVRINAGIIQAKIQQPTDSDPNNTGAIYCLISEAGSYTHPIKYEAQAVTSTGTNNSTNWGESEMINITSTKQQNYSSPVVLGQVMSYNNSDFSTFWSSNCTSRTSPPTNTSLCIGKHTSQTDASITQSEQIGYFIAERAQLTLANAYLDISLGSDRIRGVGNSPPYTYNLPREYSYAVISQSAMDGSNGGWAVLYGNNPISSQLNLAIDEDTVLGDTTRTHTSEQVAYWAIEPIYKNYANLLINEVLYQQNTDEKEFVELVVLSNGSLLNYIVSSQDGASQNNRLPDIEVATGDYVILHFNTGTNYSANNIHHIYTQSTVNQLNNTGDDILLLKPSSSDITQLNDTTQYNAIPVDYMAYGTGSALDPPPISMDSVTVSWNNQSEQRLGGCASGQSISLTPNAIDTDQSACWEKTTSGEASNCTNAKLTIDTDTRTTVTHSLGKNNTSAPQLSVQKFVSTIYDPVNGTNNPKAIPNSILEYTITATNYGDLATDNNSIRITDSIPPNTQLCVANIGYCTPPYFIDNNSGLSYDQTLFSNSTLDNFTYNSLANTEGGDSNIKHLQMLFNGAFAAKTTNITPSFSVKFRVIIY